MDCKCKGCRNPHRPGGGKVRPALPVNLQNMKVFYPAERDPAQPVVFEPIQTFPEKVVYSAKSGTNTNESQKIVYPLRTFPSKNLKDQAQVATIRMPVSLGKTINIKDLDPTKIPILASGTESGSAGNTPNKTSSRINSRSNSAHK